MNGTMNERGNALIVVLTMIMVLSGLSAFMLSNAFHKSKAAELLVENSRSLHLAEAGVDRAVEAINNDIDLTQNNAVTLAVLGTDTGRKLAGNGNYFVTVVDWSKDGVDNDGVNGVDDNGEKYFFTVTSTAIGDLRAQWPVEKTVEAIFKRQTGAGFAKAMFGKDNVTLGGTVFTDSYDSEFGTYNVQKDPTAPGHLAACRLCSALGYIDASLHTDAHSAGKPIGFRKGDVGSNGPIGDVGTVDVYGNSTAGPGFATTITSNCYIYGSTAPSPTPVPLPLVPCDAPSGCLPVPNNGTTASTLTNSAVLAGGTYQCGAISLGNKQVLQITGNVVLYVTGDITLTAKEEMRITGTGSLTIYHKSGNVKIVGGSNTNTSGKPLQLKLFSETSGTIDIGGNSTWSGSIYAPNAPTKLAGNTEYFGSVTGQSITCQGTVDFHYDEALGRQQISVAGPCELKAWREVR